MTNFHPLSLDEALVRFVRELNQNRILTQRELTDAASMTRSMLSAWLSGRRGITLRTASRLVNVVGLTAFARFLLALDLDSDKQVAIDLDRIREARDHIAERIANFETAVSGEGGDS